MAPDPRLGLHRFYKLAAIVVVLALSGCVAGGPKDASPQSADATMPPETRAAPSDTSGQRPGSAATASAMDTIPWVLTRCQIAEGAVATTREAVQPFLPPGFRPLTGYPFVPGLANAGVVALVFETFKCESGSSMKETIGPMDYASYWVAVEPPPALLVKGAEDYTFNWNPLIPDAARRGWFAQHGIAVEGGKTTIRLDAGPATQVRASAEWSSGTLTFVGETSRPFQILNAPFAEYTASSTGRLARWQATAQIFGNPDEFTEGHGLVTFPAGSVPSRILGRETSHASLWIAKASFEGTVTVLPPG